MRLLELKKWYQKYQNFRPEWKEYNYNGLNNKKILATIETLPINENEIMKMKNLRCNTFQDVLNNYGRSEFHQPEIFNKILMFDTIARKVTYITI